MTSYEKPRNIRINWTHIRDFQWKGNKTGYVIHYQKVKEGGVRTISPEIKLKVPYIDSYVLPLNVSAQYLISVAGETPIGEGPTSFSQVLGENFIFFNDFFSKCVQNLTFLRISSHLRRNLFMLSHFVPSNCKGI